MDHRPASPPEEITRRIIEHRRSLTPAQRFQEAQDLIDFVTQAQMAAVRAERPDADEFEVKMRVASRWVRNKELLKGAFGWDVDVEGY